MTPKEAEAPEPSSQDFEPWQVSEEVDILEPEATHEDGQINWEGQEPEEKAQAESPPDSEEVTEQAETGKPSWRELKWDQYDWSDYKGFTGEAESILEPLKFDHKNMVRGFQEQMREAAEARKSYEAKLEELNSQRAAPPEQEQGPPPLDDSSLDALARSMDARAEYHRNQTLKAIQQENEQRFSKLEPQIQKMTQSEAEREREVWLDKTLRNREDYRPEIEEHMVQMINDAAAKGDMGPAMSATTNYGIFGLFEAAKQAMGPAPVAKDVVVEQSDKAQTARKRAMSRPSEGGTTRKTTEDNLYGKSFKDIARLTAREMGYNGRV